MSSAPPAATPAEPPAPAPKAQASAPAPAPAPAPPAASAPAAPPAAEGAPAPAPRVAALPPPSTPVQGRVGAIPFASGAADLPADSKSVLDQAAAQLKRDDEARLQIVAYASGGDDAGSQARRLSLSRALAVRSYLIDQGVRSTRMDVRALGNKSPDGPADRVDILMVHR
ncbi:MAG TPA: OmpA family protein [Alphaproteobacteria bacterium]|nr:OmpA family protein [Alphaproteobacteria bacterium]